MTLLAFLRARWRADRLRDRGRLLAWQERRLRQFLLTGAPCAAAFKELAGRPLSDFPVMDKSGLMDRFEDYNIARITAAEAWQALAGRGLVRRYTVGASTGTSGNRGLYLVSDAERYLWLGTLLAKALPDFLARRYRVAVMLPQSSRLYDAANESGRLALKFFDLTEGLEPQLSDVAAFRPSVIVAPPQALVALARSPLPFQLTHVFSGAEVLDPIDRREIVSRFGGAVREIYMATEGLFAVSCAAGTLHLCEDCVAFEWEPEGDLMKPIITDFTRRSQIMVRYRMNDLLRLSADRCACGSPLQAVSEVVGRADDCLRLKRADGVIITVTPDVVRNAVVDADRRISDFRVTQTGPAEILLALPPCDSPALPAAGAALSRLLTRLGTSPEVKPVAEPLATAAGTKRRRVIRERSFDL